MSNSQPKKLAFKKNQYIVYPIQGVGKIVDITELSFGTTTQWYYIIELNEVDMIVKIPVDKAEELGVRLLGNKKEADALDEIFFKPIPELSSDWKQRYQQSLDLLRKGQLVNIAEVVYILYTRKKVKELPILERKLYDNALQLLIDELMLIYEKDEKTITEELFAKMNVFSETLVEESNGSDGTKTEIIIEADDESTPE